MALGSLVSLVPSRADSAAVKLNPRVLLAGLAVVAPLVAVLLLNLGRNPHVIGSPLVGRTAPEFTLRPLGGGEPVTLASLRGRPAVLNFWATWCVPCFEEHPLLREHAPAASATACASSVSSTRTARSRCAASWRGRARPTRRSSIPAAARRSPSACSACPRRTSSTPEGRSPPSTSGRSTPQSLAGEAAAGGARAMRRLRRWPRPFVLPARRSRARSRTRPRRREPARVVGAPRGQRARGRGARRAHRGGGRPAALPGVPGPLGGRLARHDGRQHEGRR